MCTRDPSLQRGPTAANLPARPRGPAAPPDASIDLSGELLGTGYRLLRRLGPDSALYQARHVTTRARVMVRVEAAPSGAAAQRFLRDTRGAAKLRHGYIIHVVDFGLDILSHGEPVAYTVMEYLSGEDLAATLEREGPLGWTRVLAIARQVCRALIAAHDRGAVHGNIQATTCFRVRRDDGSDLIKLMDFGAASAAPDDATRRGGSDPRDDIHALGALMYRLLTGAAAYPPARPRQLAGGATATDVDAAPRAVAARRSIPAPALPPAFEALLLAMLAPDAALRPPTARALYRALAAAEPVAAPGLPALRPAAPPPRTPLFLGSTRSDHRDAAFDPGMSSVWQASKPRGWFELDWALVFVATTTSMSITVAVIRSTWTLLT